MTTRVRVEVVQKHMPVVVEVLYNDGTIKQVQVLNEIGTSLEDYVHSGQMLRIREMTTEEAHNSGL